MQPAQILILENQPINARLMRYYLHRATNYQVTAEVSTLAQAKECLNKLNVDIIILGVSQSSSINTAVIDWLASHRLKVKVLTFAQSSTKMNIAEATEHRIDAVLYEDASLSELNEALGRLTQKNAVYDNTSNMHAELLQDAQTNNVARKISLLTTREKEILKLVLDGCTNNEIAQEMEISVRTVENHRANILRKTNGKNFFYLAKIIFKNKLLNMY